MRKLNLLLIVWVLLVQGQTSIHTPEATVPSNEYLNPTGTFEPNEPTNIQEASTRSKRLKPNEVLKPYA